MTRHGLVDKERMVITLHPFNIRVRNDNGTAGSRVAAAGDFHRRHRHSNHPPRRMVLAVVHIILVFFIQHSSLAFQPSGISFSHDSCRQRARQQPPLQQQSTDQQVGNSKAAETAFTITTSSSSPPTSSPLSLPSTVSFSPLVIRQLQRCKTNKDVELEIVRLGRNGRTAEALQLYHAVNKLDELRQTLIEEDGEGEEATYVREQQQQQSLQLVPRIQSQTIIASQELRPLLKSKLRPTTRLMNSAIDACAKSSQLVQYVDSTVAAAAPLLPSRTEIALNIFNSGTSSWWHDGYRADNNNNSEAVVVEIETKRNNRKKRGGALSPNVYTFGALLACCARDGDIQTSLELLTTLEDGSKYPDVELNDVIYSTVISACANACTNADATTSCTRYVQLALDVLNRGISNLYQRTTRTQLMESSTIVTTTATGLKKFMGVVGYNAAISTMARAGEWKMAVQLLGEMILYSSSSKSKLSSSSLLIQRDNPNFAPMELIRDNLNQRRLLLLPTSLEDETSLDDVSNRIIIPKPDAVTFGTVLAACERAREWETLLNVAKAAMEYGVTLDGLSLTNALHACQQLGLADEALEYLELMKYLGNNDDDDTIESNATSFISGDDRRHREGAKQALRGPDGVAYRLAISACARAPGGQRWKDGIRLLREMKEVDMARKLALEQPSPSSNATARFIVGTDCAPDVMAYTAAISGCSEAGEYMPAMALLSEMRRECIPPNVMTFSAVINACATASAKLARKKDDDDSGGSGILESVQLPMNRALRLLEAMKSPSSSIRPNIVTYNAAIRACAEGCNLNGAFELLKQLKDDGIEPSIVTYGSLMTACERVGDVDAASRVFRMVRDEEKKNLNVTVDEKQRIRVNEIIYGAAISCCRKAQQPERALFLLRKMMDEKLAPNTATFNTVIAALAESKSLTSSPTKSDTTLLEKTLAVYRVMKSKHAPSGVAPDRKTYNILIRCLSSNLQPGYAESLLIDMRKDGFIPDVDLYTMTVRSYERCGNLMKALSLMESMREMGYDFYNVKVLDKAFKNGVKILNRMGKGFSTEDSSRVNNDVDRTGVLNALSEETRNFDDYD